MFKTFLWPIFRLEKTTQTSYDGNTTNYTYDDASRLTQLQAPGSRTYANNYDNANRLTTEALPSTVNVHYVYDAINRPTSLTYVIPDGGSIFSQPSSDKPQHRKLQTKQSSFNTPRTNQPSFLEIGHLTERVFRDILLTWKLNQGTLETIKQKYGIDSEEAWEYQVAINNLFRLSALGDITVASFTPTYSAASRILTEEDFMDGTTTNYTFKIENEEISITVDNETGEVISVTSKTGSAFGKAIAKGIEAACDKIQEEGASINSIPEFFLAMQPYAEKNYWMWEHVYNGEEPTSEFFKHATIGFFISKNMQKYSNSSYSSYNSYDMDFGFWASVWAQSFDLEITILPTYRGRPTDDTPLSLVDVANISKAVGYQESRLNTGTERNEQGYAGIMQVYYGGTYEFNDSKTVPASAAAFTFYNNSSKFYESFNNIGIGVGYLFTKIVTASHYPYLSGNRRAPKFLEWIGGDLDKKGNRKIGAVQAYGPHKGPNNTLVNDYYYQSVRSIFLYGYWQLWDTGIDDPINKKHTLLFDANSYYRNRKIGR
jgi:YD repeat-containing protein